MRRRQFITLLGGATAWLLAAGAQQQAGTIARIGVLTTGLEDAVSGGPGYRAFVAELERLGFAEGRNLVIEVGRTDKGADRAFADAAAMVRANVAVIVSSGADLPLEAAMGASPTVPIVMLASNYDPIARGYVASLARPGGRVTGFFYRQPELTLELLAEAFPGMRRLAVLWDENVGIGCLPYSSSGHMRRRVGLCIMAPTQFRCGVAPPTMSAKSCAERGPQICQSSRQRRSS